MNLGWNERHETGDRTTRPGDDTNPLLRAWGGASNGRGTKTDRVETTNCPRSPRKLKGTRGNGVAGTARGRGVGEEGRAGQIIKTK